MGRIVIWNGLDGLIAPYYWETAIDIVLSLFKWTYASYRSNVWRGCRWNGNIQSAILLVWVSERVKIVVRHKMATISLPMVEGHWPYLSHPRYFSDHGKLIFDDWTETIATGFTDHYYVFAFSKEKWLIQMNITFWSSELLWGPTEEQLEPHHTVEQTVP